MNEHEENTSTVSQQKETIISDQIPLKQPTEPSTINTTISHLNSKQRHRSISATPSLDTTTTHTSPSNVSVSPLPYEKNNINLPSTTHATVINPSSTSNIQQQHDASSSLTINNKQNPTNTQQKNNSSSKIINE